MFFSSANGNQPEEKGNHAKQFGKCGQFTALTIELVDIAISLENKQIY
jgi:hypothetical protein